MMKLAIGLTRAWVRLYTKGLPPELRDDRRAEIESDLWEQGYDGEANGHDPQETGAEVLLRLVAGLPADLTWRLGQIGARRSAGKNSSILAKGGNLMQTVLEKGMMGLTLVLGLFWILVLPINAMDGGGSVFGVVLVVAVGIALVTGVLVSGRLPWLGVGLVALGSLVGAAATYWMLVITLPVAIVLIASAVFRARRLTRRSDRTAAA
jgi:hypothetical protein